MSSNRKSLWQIFRAPVLLGALSLIGLVGALVGDGLFDLLSWTTLGSALAVIAWYWAKPTV